MANGGYIAERILLTNDDGIDAPGLRVLEDIASQLAREVWIVAPAHDQSGVSHAISLHHPLRITTEGERRFAVQGTPGDCVAVGIRHLMLGRYPDLVLSGVNRGANLGVETVFSGTVGAAMTGLLMGIPSIALSQAFSAGAPPLWETACKLGPGVIRDLARLPWASSACLNVNFPDCTPDQARSLMLTRQGAGLLEGIDVVTRSDPRSLTYYWLALARKAKEGAEADEASSLTKGHITATPLQFERTAETVLEMMKAVSGSDVGEAN